MTWPICGIPVAPVSATASATRALDLLVAQLRRQVGLEDGELGVLLGGQLGPPGVGVGGRGLAALLGLLGEHLEHLVVASSRASVPDDLLVGDGGEGHPQRAGPHLVALTHRVGEVGAAGGP